VDNSRWTVGALLVAALIAATFAASAPAAAPAEMVEIAAGAYPIGSDDGPQDERPRHTVTLGAFRIDRFEVTNGQFAAFLNDLLSSASAPDIQLVGAASPGTADARVIRGRDAALLMENLSGPSDQTLVALNDAESRIGVGGGRLIPQRGSSNTPSTR
jgi:formylglycine-generating enzyme required for sulfatase activity